ncbi:pathogenicity island 1 protein SopD2 [Salmonella enterica subsp. enterica]|uniref:Pathogenicity island 1 protein SopD2 n=1 Tax=Salmonella enterica I TaxID=59201 RepID=A0A3S4I1V4_SALET|nr:pathogenicity island 1 protein SopD2 [Salmonella enterica subsp. enterica]
MCLNGMVLLLKRRRINYAVFQMGSFNIILPNFFKIGYWELEGEVLFDMVHPTLSYLLQAYKPSLSSDLIETNTMLFSDVLNKDYDDYQNNKREIDAILRRIYRSHNNTLFISEKSSCRNMLI